MKIVYTISIIVMLSVLSMILPVYAEQGERMVQNLSEETVQRGIEIHFNEILFSVAPNIFSEETQVRLIDKGMYNKEEIVNLPKQYQSKNSVYTYSFSNQFTAPMTVVLDYKGRKNRKRKVFYMEPGFGKWQKLRTVIDRKTNTVRVQIENNEGQLLVAGHTSKKAAPIKKRNYQLYPGIAYSDAAAVIDAKSGKFLYRKNAKKKRSIASISKIVTALIFLDTKPNFNEVVTYTKENDRIGSQVNLEEGDQISKEQLLIGTLLKSANNMAVTMSQSTEYSEKEFIAAMNRRMKKKKFRATSFVEPTGLNKKNRSTAGNLARIGRYIFNKYPDFFYDLAQMESYSFNLSNRDASITLYSTNKFDGQGKYTVEAFKTGYLPGSAERTLLMKVKEKSTGYEIILVLLGNPQYNTIFQEAYDIANWTFQNWEFHNY